MKLRAGIDRITYQNAENGYSILRARVKGYDENIGLNIETKSTIWLSFFVFAN